MENVNHPSHYQGSIECIDGLESILTPEQFEGFLLGNALKYLWRAGKKGNKLEDYRKAEWYLRKLMKVESTKQNKHIIFDRPLVDVPN